MSILNFERVGSIRLLQIRFEKGDGLFPCGFCRRLVVAGRGVVKTVVDAGVVDHLIFFAIGI